MPLLRNGRVSDEDRWHRLGDDEPLPDAVPGTEAGVALSLPRFLAHAAGEEAGSADSGQVAGVWLAPADDALALAPWLGRLQLVAIDFPAYTDGRGYSQARQLRRRLGFDGEIRAFGDVRPDQVLFMMRSGIDAFEFDTAPDAASLRQALSRYRTSYQPSYPLPIAG